MSFLEWFLLVILGVIYLTCIFTVAGITFRNGHWILGILGIFFPVFWLVGAVLPPTEAAVADDVLES
jgi:NhaP-type Na+/H+ or K+/H+ antiporter